MVQKIDWYNVDVYASVILIITPTYSKIPGMTSYSMPMVEKSIIVDTWYMNLGTI